MQYQEFLQIVSQFDHPVILLEGTRDLPDKDKSRLIDFARNLTIQLPHAKFRTGNASGSDEAFAEGVASLSPERLEYVLPHFSMRQKNRQPKARYISLEEVCDELEQRIISETVKASAKYQGLMTQRAVNSKLRIKSNYLLRDTLKVLGCAEAVFDPAQIGIFYANPSDIEQGGTGHTIRVCRQFNVPVITQQSWLNWFPE